jgi:hypothetical protein
MLELKNRTIEPLIGLLFPGRRYQKDSALQWNNLLYWFSGELKFLYLRASPENRIPGIFVIATDGLALKC